MRTRSTMLNIKIVAMITFIVISFASANTMANTWIVTGVTTFGCYVRHTIPIHLKYSNRVTSRYNLECTSSRDGLKYVTTESHLGRASSGFGNYQSVKWSKHRVNMSEKPYTQKSVSVGCNNSRSYWYSLRSNFKAELKNGKIKVDPRPFNSNIYHHPNLKAKARHTCG